MGTKRVFIAADISDELRSKAAAYVAALRERYQAKGISWVRPENFHITLRFLGDADDGVISKIESDIAGAICKFESFRISSAKNASFGKRVLMVRIADLDGRLVQLVASLENICQKYGFPAEKRKFSPHLTVARLRRPHNIAGLINDHEKNRIEPVEFDIRKIVIYESRVGQGGSSYEPISKILLRQK